MNKKITIHQLAAASLITAFSFGAHAESQFITNALFNPSESLLVAEVSGRVMIYDGLKNETVERALDQQFDRIESMMFVRTLVAQEDGSVQAEDDCD